MKRIEYNGLTIDFAEKIDFKLLSYKLEPKATFMTTMSEDKKYLYIDYCWEDTKRKLFNYEEEAFSIGVLDTPEKKDTAYAILVILYNKLYEEYSKNPTQEFDMEKCLIGILGDEPFQLNNIKVLKI